MRSPGVKGVWGLRGLGCSVSGVKVQGFRATTEKLNEAWGVEKIEPNGLWLSGVGGFGRFLGK